MIVTPFTILPAQVELLNFLSEKLGRSRSDLIREAIVLLAGDYKNVIEK